jgi:hypothetical protein
LFEGLLELLFHIEEGRRQARGQRIQFHCDARESLQERVMQLLSNPFSFILLRCRL